MIVFTIDCETIVLALLVIFVIVSLIIIIVTECLNKILLKLKLRYNCYECMYYKLDNVASAGDCCWYKCTKTNRIDRTTFNNSYRVCKCKSFEQKRGERNERNKNKFNN